MISQPWYILHHLIPMHPNPKIIKLNKIKNNNKIVNVYYRLFLYKKFIILFHTLKDYNYYHWRIIDI